MMDRELVPVGIVRSPYKMLRDAPRQGRIAGDVAEIEIDPAFADGLDSIEKYRHIIVLSWFHRADRNLLRVIPPGQSEERGVFAARSPHRPNQIGRA